jgi:nicotinic acid phosphoribosyltransferase
MVFVLVHEATLSVEAGSTATIANLIKALATHGYPPDYYVIMMDGQYVDQNRLVTEFGENPGFVLEIIPEIKPLWDTFWATAQKDLEEYPVGHPFRVAFETNLWSQRLEFLAIMKLSATGDFSSATIACDLYKLTMAPVIDHAQREKGEIVVSFALSLRTDGLEQMLVQNQDGIRDSVLKALDGLKHRTFKRDVISATTAGKTTETFWLAKLDEICGPEGAPRSLIRRGRISPETDYWSGTVILNRKAVPADVHDGEVVLSVFFDEKGKLHIEATGPWNRCTFLETTMMQAVYQVLLEHHLRKRGVSFGHWLYEALFRTHLSCTFATEVCPKMKGALFAGRRTGHHIFTLFQTWYASRYYPNCIGTSSFDAWYTLTKVLGMPKIVPPAGTHAHELSMVYMCLYPELDQNPEGIPFSQAKAHADYYRLVHQGFTTPMPMLPDTLGTHAFMKAAENTKVTYMMDGVPQPHGVSFLKVLTSARQDSGTIEEFSKTLAEYPDYKGTMMASEISSCKDLVTARVAGYASFGAGGFMGDSESVWSVNKERLSVSMAVKPVRVYLNGVRTEVQPVKLGDGASGKATCDTTLPKETQETILRNANLIKQAAIDVPHGLSTMEINDSVCSIKYLD